MHILQNAKWRGNVRELENLIERLVITTEADVIKKSNVDTLIGKTTSDPQFPKHKTYKELMHDFEKNLLESMMLKHGKASVVSRELQIDKATLHRRLDKYDLL